jgi:hypothetical protein
LVASFKELKGFWIYFSNEKCVSGVHGLVDRARRWSMVDHLRRQPSGSLERSLEAALVGGGSSRMHENDEGTVAVLIVCLNSFLGGGERLTAEVDGGGDFLSLRSN